MITAPTSGVSNGVLITSSSPSDSPDPKYEPHFDTSGRCVNDGGGIPIVLDSSQCANAGLDCPNGQQTLVIPQDDDDAIFNSDPCLTIVLTSDDDEDEENNEDEEDNEDVDEGVQNKLDNINESTNDEDAPINQPDNNNNNNVQQQQPQPLSTVPSTGGDGGLTDACLQSNISPQLCRQSLFSTNPGNACGLAAAGGGGCVGGVQDPSKTFTNPGAAAAESNKKIQQLENGLQGFAETQQQTEQQKKTIENSLRLNPPGDLGSIFAGPGSTTNR